MAVGDLNVGSSAPSPRLVKKAKVKIARKAAHTWLIDGEVIKIFRLEQGIYWLDRPDSRCAGGVVFSESRSDGSKKWHEASVVGASYIPTDDNLHGDCDVKLYGKGRLLKYNCMLSCNLLTDAFDRRYQK